MSALVESNHYVAATTVAMHQELNNLGHVETRPETLPLTPVSAKTNLSSQTSTGKSGKSRRFDQKWLATPLSTGAGSPVSKREPSTQSPQKSPSLVSPSIESMPSSPTADPPRPVLTYLPPSNCSAPSHVEQNQTTASSHHDPTFSSHVGSYYTQTFGELPPHFQVAPPSFGGAPRPLGGHRLPINPYSYYASNLPGPTVVHHATIQASPSPQSNASSAYGGEAHHRMPIGINISPPVCISREYGAYAIVPAVSSVTEDPVVHATPEKQDVQADVKGTSSAKLGKSRKKHWYRRSRELDA